MAVFYITEQGASIHKTSKRLLVVKDEKPLQVMRIHEVDRIVLYGNVQLTTQAMTFMLDEGIEVSFLSRGGRFQGRLSPADSKNIPLRLAQYDRYRDDEFRLSLARRIVGNKIANGRSVLLKYAKNHPEVELEKEIVHLEASAGNVNNQDSISALMGVEGESAATYFRAYGRMFRKDLQFSERTRRPPRDPVNSLLSLGYALLTSEITSSLAAHGLDVYIGFLHEIEYGRPSLALDLVEEFRQPVVDRFVLSLANKKVMTDEDFDNRGGDGVFLQKESCKRYFALYDRMMTTSFKNQSSGEEMTFRSLLLQKAQQIVKCILQKENYEPFCLN
jgi:CRISPR-associated protein Cas1